MYLFVSSTVSQCQQITNFNSYGYGQLRLAETEFFMLGVDPLSPYILHLYKIAYGEASPAWALKLACPSGSCVVSNSESLFLSSTIYSFFTYGSTKYLYLVAISEVDGTVLAKYKSSVSWDYVNGATISGDYILASACGKNLLIFNKVSNAFSIKSFSGTSLSGIIYDSLTSRYNS